MIRSALLCLCLIATQGWAQLRGVSVQGVNFSQPAVPFFASLPVSWVNSALTIGNGFCSTTFDATKTMPGDYAATFAGLIQAKTDQAAAHQNWLLVVSTSVNIHGSTYDANNALVSFPVTTYEAGKCLTIRSSNHNPDGQTVCSTPYPTAYDANCASGAGHFWKITVDSTPTTGNTGIYLPYGSNNIIIEDLEIAPAAGSSQSKSGVKVVILIEDHGDHNGFAYNWIHGWDPGDSGQPGAGSGNSAVDNATGACLAWNRSGTVNTSGTAVTWVSGDRFGMDFSDGTHSSGYPQAQITINGTAYTISSHDPAASDTALTLATSAGTQTGVAFSLQNPASRFTPGCGDDSRGVQLVGSNTFFAYSQVNKIHWWNGESHNVSLGFGSGPYKVVHTVMACGAICLFAGGGSIQIRGGPGNDYEVRGNLFLRDLNYRFLTGSARQSPFPPFGCGPLNAVAAGNNTAPFKWGVKNNVEFKFGSRILLDGNILDGVWADGQTGYLLLLTVKADNSMYDPNTGLPYAALTDVTVSNNWFRNAPQIIQLINRSLGAGNGNGLSQPLRRLDFAGNLFTNVKDTAQFGNPGPDIAQWPASGQTFLATVSRTSNVAHAVVSPMRVASFDPGTNNVGTYKNSFSVTSVSSVADVVTIVTDTEWDPTVGGTVTVGGAAGWNGSFTIAGVKNGSSSTACSKDVNGNPVSASVAVQPQPCIRADGSFGDTAIYTDSINHPGTATLCTSAATCTAAGIQVTLDSLDYKFPNISVGDGVYVHDCTDATLNSGASSFNPAVAPTSPTGTDVYYASSGSNTSGISCQLENTAGFPANTTWQYNTVLATGINSIGSQNNGTADQHYKNYFIHNVFGMPAGNNAVLTDSSIGGQGSAVYVVWDQNTFQFFDNVMQGRTAGQWSVVPSGSLANAFPTSIGCPGATADATCLGYSGYMSGTAFPTSACTYDGSNPNNCPLMAAPWSTNFDLTKIAYVPTSSYRNQGVNLTTLGNAFTRTQYTCPAGAGASCTPFPD